MGVCPTVKAWSIQGREQRCESGSDADCLYTQYNGSGDMFLSSPNGCEYQGGSGQVQSITNAFNPQAPGCALLPPVGLDAVGVGILCGNLACASIGITGFGSPGYQVFASAGSDYLRSVNFGDLSMCPAGLFYATDFLASICTICSQFPPSFNVATLIVTVQ